MGTTRFMKKVWLTLAIVIGVLMPIYGAWHHLFTLGICLIMYWAHKNTDDEPPKIIGKLPIKRSV